MFLKLIEHCLDKTFNVVNDVVDFTKILGNLKHKLGRGACFQLQQSQCLVNDSYDETENRVANKDDQSENYA